MYFSPAHSKDYRLDFVSYASAQAFEHVTRPALRATGGLLGGRRYSVAAPEPTTKPHVQIYAGTRHRILASFEVDGICVAQHAKERFQFSVDSLQLLGCNGLPSLVELPVGLQLTRDSESVHLTINQPKLRYDPETFEALKAFFGPSRSPSVGSHHVGSLFRLTVSHAEVWLLPPASSNTLSLALISSVVQLELEFQSLASFGLDIQGVSSRLRQFSPQTSGSNLAVLLENEVEGEPRYVCMPFNVIMSRETRKMDVSLVSFRASESDIREVASILKHSSSRRQEEERASNPKGTSFLLFVISLGHFRDP
jgi:hypothetical protein